MNDPLILPRLLRDNLAFALQSFPVVVLTGSRQTGKSTLLLALRERDSRTYLTLDDLDVLERVRQEPDALVRSAARVALDEVQRSPDLLLAVKRAVDERREPGRFVLTGAANLLLMRRISETLAGRAIHLTLWPITRREQLGLGLAGAWSRLFEVEDAVWPEVLRAADAPEEDWRGRRLSQGIPGPDPRRTAAPPARKSVGSPTACWLRPGGGSSDAAGAPFRPRPLTVQPVMRQCGGFSSGRSCPDPPIISNSQLDPEERHDG